MWRPEEYERLFDGAPEGTLRGESTAFYLQDFDAHRRIAEAVPDARLILILRDPVDRAYSNWAHLWADGLEPNSDFLSACAEEAGADRGRLGSHLAVPGDRSVRPADPEPADPFRSRTAPHHPLQGTGGRAGGHAGRGVPLPGRGRRRAGRGAAEERRRVRPPHAVHPGAPGDAPTGRVGGELLPTPGVAQGQPPAPVADPADPAAPSGTGRAGPGHAHRLLRRRHRRCWRPKRAGTSTSGAPTARAVRTRCASRGHRRGASSRSRGAARHRAAGTTEV